MFEQWVHWQIAISVEDNPYMCGNQTTNEMLDYFITKWAKRVELLSRTIALLNG